MGGSICGGSITWTEWKKIMKQPDQIYGYMMATVRRRVKVRGHYKYLVRLVQGDEWEWET